MAHKKDGPFIGYMISPGAHKGHIGADKNDPLYGICLYLGVRRRWSEADRPTRLVGEGDPGVGVVTVGPRSARPAQPVKVDAGLLPLTQLQQWNDRFKKTVIQGALSPKRDNCSIRTGRFAPFQALICARKRRNYDK